MLYADGVLLRQTVPGLSVFLLLHLRSALVLTCVLLFSSWLLQCVLSLPTGTPIFCLCTMFVVSSSVQGTSTLTGFRLSLQFVGGQQASCWLPVHIYCIGGTRFYLEPDSDASSSYVCLIYNSHPMGCRSTCSASEELCYVCSHCMVLLGKLPVVQNNR